MKKVEKRTGYILSFDNTKIYYELRGHGEPIIMIYGIACLMNHWRHQIKYFSNSHQTLVYDLRGHHKSPPPKNLDQLTMEALARDLNSLLVNLGISRAHFWGHSFGAQIILKTYDLFPERFRSIAFVNGFAKNPIKGMFGLDVVEKFYHLIKTRYYEHPVFWKKLWKYSVTNPLAVPLSALAGGFNLKLTSLKDIEIYARGVASMDLPVFLKLFEEIMNYNGEPVLEKIQVPTLIISGEKDLVTPKKYQAKMYQKIPNCEILSVPYGSHCTQLDFPDLVNLRLEKFLNDH